VRLDLKGVGTNLNSFRLVAFGEIEGLDLDDSLSKNGLCIWIGSGG
jgi:hypothetical protein